MSHSHTVTNKKKWYSFAESAKYVIIPAEEYGCVHFPGIFSVCAPCSLSCSRILIEPAWVCMLIWYGINSVLFSAGVAINDSWSQSSVRTFDWTGKFVSPAPLYFELSIGTQMGSGRIRKWVELSTAQTSYSVSGSVLQRSEDYFVAVTAISSSGLHTTASQLIPSMPLGM